MADHDTTLTADAVIRAYRLALGRLPESVERIIEQQAAHTDYDALVSSLLASPEHRERLAVVRSPVFYAFDPAPLFAASEDRDRRARSGAIVNFLGVSTDLRFVSWAREGVEGLPRPGNFHASEAEWAAVLRAVDLARGSFTVCELGAGWGCWMVNAAVAARRNGLGIFAIGVEAEASHVDWIAAHCAANGVGPAQFRFEHAVVDAAPGFMAFPVGDDPGAQYGFEPRRFADEAALAAFLARDEGRGYARTPCLTLEALFARERRIDLLHVDIQGGERRLIETGLATLNEKVAYLFVGAHGRAIEGALIDALGGAGWVLEVEEPCTHPAPLTDNVPYIDGAQGWRNPRLASA